MVSRLILGYVPERQITQILSKCMFSVNLCARHPTVQATFEPQKTFVLAETAIYIYNIPGKTFQDFKKYTQYIYTVGALIMRLSNSAAKINFKKQ